MKVIPEMRPYARFYYKCTEMHIAPVVRGSTMTWFIRHIYIWHLQSPNNVIINKTKVQFPSGRGNQLVYPV